MLTNKSYCRYHQCYLILLLGLIGVTQVALAGQGLFLRINSYFSDGQVKVLSQNCLNTKNSSLELNTDNYIEANDNIFCNPSSITFILQKNNLDIGAPTKIILSEFGSKLPSPSVQSYNGINIVTMSYPHFGLKGSQDRVTIAFGPPTDSWMKQKQEFLRSRKPINIIIPGSHDTGTYGTDVTSSTISADFDQELGNFLKMLGKKGKRILKNWSTVQVFDTSTQLTLGIRYLDLRLCKTNEGYLYTCHGLTGAILTDVLSQLVTFLSQPGHENEWVILDFNHIYGYQAGEILDDLANLLSTKLGDKLASPLEFSNDSTFEDYWKQKKQVIAILSDADYHDTIKYYPKLFWPKHLIASPWPNVQNLASLKQAMTENLQQRNLSAYFVLQTQETPNNDTIIRSLAHNNQISLSDTTAKSIIPGNPTSILDFTGVYKNDVHQWLKDNKPLLQKQGNIIIEDFTNGLDLTFLAQELNK